MGLYECCWEEHTGCQGTCAPWFLELAQQGTASHSWQDLHVSSEASTRVLPLPHGSSPEARLLLPAPSRGGGT